MIGKIGNYKMFRKILLVSAVLTLSTGAALAASNAPQPGGKGMHDMMGTPPGSMMGQSMPGCSAPMHPQQMGSNRMMQEHMMSGGRDGRRNMMMGTAAPCRAPMGTPAEELQRRPYGKR